MATDFSSNLALLCSYRPSIAEVCRRLRVNRQQFNKYLSGQSRPSRHNMRRICDFFGVSEAEILMDPPQFEEIVSVRRKPAERADLQKPLRHLEQLYGKSQGLQKYVGYYFRYFFSFGNKGLIIRSLASIHGNDGKYYWKNIEILREIKAGKTIGLNKYEGVVFFLADRVYIVEYETLKMNSITQVTLYPSHQTRVGRLMGIQTGGPTRRGRKPGASRVALDYLGKHIDLRQALGQCGLFSAESEAAQEELVKAITNEINPGMFVLEVDEP